MKKVCVIGLGWLGEQIGDYLNKQGYFVSGTTTRQEKLEHLNVKYNTAFKLDITKEKSGNNALLGEYDYYILTIPPALNVLDYSKRMSDLISYISTLNSSAKFIYTSSTSVYGANTGEVDEDSTLNPQKSSVNEIVELESFLQKYYSADAIILRLGGLCGFNRHPSISLSGKENIKKPRAGVNLVHAEDVCRFIHFIINNGFKSGVFNFCSSEHPEKRLYYQWAASRLNVPKPLFDENDNLKDKTVICKAILNLDFKLEYDSPYDYPELQLNE